jgi:hypothetical protein
MSRSRVLGIAAVAALVLAVAAAAIQLANLQHHATPPNGQYEAKLEGNLLKVIDPRTGKVVAQGMVVRFVNLTVVRAEFKLEGNLLKVIDPRTGKVVAQGMVVRFVNLTVVRAEFKLEGNLLKVIDPRTGKVIGQMVIRFVNSSAVRAVPEAAPSNGVERYEIKPAIIRVTVPISGTLPPSSVSIYGPYSGAIDLQIQLSWSPASYVCVGYVNASTGSGPATCTYGTSISADFPINPSETIYVTVGNFGSDTITYSGTLTLYYN